MHQGRVSQRIAAGPCRSMLGAGAFSLHLPILGSGIALGTTRTAAPGGPATAVLVDRCRRVAGALDELRTHPLDDLLWVIASAVVQFPRALECDARWRLGREPARRACAEAHHCRGTNHDAVGAKHRYPQVVSSRAVSQHRFDPARGLEFEPVRDHAREAAAFAANASIRAQSLVARAS